MIKIYSYLLGKDKYYVYFPIKKTKQILDYEIYKVCKNILCKVTQKLSKYQCEQLTLSPLKM